MTTTKYKLTFDCVCGETWSIVDRDLDKKQTNCPRCNGEALWLSAYERIEVEMNSEDVAEEIEELLAMLPEEMRSAISYMAYERGHSAGEFEVLNILHGIVYDLKEPLKALVKRVHDDAAKKASDAMYDLFKDKNEKQPSHPLTQQDE
jgi:hypothetical protein